MEAEKSLQEEANCRHVGCGNSSCAASTLQSLQHHFRSCKFETWFQWLKLLHLSSTQAITCKGFLSCSRDYSVLEATRRHLQNLEVRFLCTEQTEHCALRSCCFVFEPALGTRINATRLVRLIRMQQLGTQQGSKGCCPLAHVCVLSVAPIHALDEVFGHCFYSSTFYTIHVHENWRDDEMRLRPRGACASIWSSGRESIETCQLL